MFVDKIHHWAISTNEETFNSDMYKTREEAIAAIDTELEPLPNENVYLGECIAIDLEWAKNHLHLFDEDNVREQFGEAAGEVGYEWEISKEDADEINQAMIELLFKKNAPGIYAVDGVELIRKAKE